MKIRQIDGRKITKFYIQLFCVVFFNYGALCYGTDIFVDDNTCPSTGTGSNIDPFCSIQDGLNLANGGDTVFVHGGTYAEGVKMKTGVNLLNVPGEQPTIVTSTSANHVLFDRVKNCALDGFFLDDSNRTSGNGHALVSVSGNSSAPGNNLAIRNCVIRGNLADPILDRAGIRLKGQLSIEIIGNTITRHKTGGIVTKRTSLDTLNDSTVTIQGNIITGNLKAGIYLQGSGTGNRIIIGGDAGAANIISNNGNFRQSGMWLRDLQGVSIDNNEISNNRRAGMLLDNVSTVTPHIARNSIHNNFAAGINIGGHSTLTIGTNNEIFANATGGIAFATAENSSLGAAASSGLVTITGNSIHTNGTAGISVIDNATGLLTIHGNSIYQNEKAGIAFLNNCVAVITENDIHDHVGAAGIFTGAWSGGDSPSSNSIPTTLSFNKMNGPVELTIKRNKIHNNLAGMRLDHASGTISNNLVHHNTKSGIRFSGNDIFPYDPFGVVWGISSLSHNTVADNGVIIAGSRSGSGIVYDDINNASGRNFLDKPLINRDQGSRSIQNNITAYNATAGIRDAACTNGRDYNLYYLNYGVGGYFRSVLGGCTKNPQEVFSDPLFNDRIGYQLQTGSPAQGSGSNGVAMGAYGGSTPITW